MKYEKIWQKTLGGDEKVEYEFSVGNQQDLVWQFGEGQKPGPKQTQPPKLQNVK